MFLVFFFMFHLEIPEIALEDFGLYRDTNLTLFKTSGGYLLNSTSDGVAVLFSEKGTVLGRWDRRGRGPGEFNRQYVLAVDEKGIHFCSNGRLVISFDHRLKPIPSSWPNLPAQPHLNANFGLARQSGSILVSLSGRDHLFAEIENVAGGWQIKRKYFPTDTANAADGRQFLSFGKRPLVHDQTVFASKVAVSRHEDNYEIEVFDDFLRNGKTRGLSNVLAAEVEPFPSSAGVRAVIYSVVHIPDGYVVELFTHLRKGGRNRRWHDYFNSRGSFLKRVNMDDTRLLPVVNGSEVFLIDDRNGMRVLKRIY